MDSRVQVFSDVGFCAGSSHSPRLTLPHHSALSKWYFLKEASQAKIVPATIALSKSLPTRSHCLFFPHRISLSGMPLSAYVSHLPHQSVKYMRSRTLSGSLLHLQPSYTVGTQ